MTTTLDRSALRIIAEQVRERWFSIAVAAKYIHVSKETVRTMIRERMIHGIPIGKGTRVDKCELDTLMESLKAGNVRLSELFEVAKNKKVDGHADYCFYNAARVIHDR